MQRRLAVSATVCLLIALSAAPTAARQQYIDGVFTATESGDIIELIAYAEARRTGVFVMGHGSLEDAPVLPRTYRFIANVGGYNVAGVLAVNLDIFKTPMDRIEHRSLPFSAVKLNVRAVEVGVPELEDWDKVLRMRKSLRATEDAPLAFFLVLTNGAATRYYPFFINR